LLQTLSALYTSACRAPAAPQLLHSLSALLRMVTRDSLASPSDSEACTVRYDITTRSPDDIRPFSPAQYDTARYESFPGSPRAKAAEASPCRHWGAHVTLYKLLGTALFPNIAHGQRMGSAMHTETLITSSRDTKDALHRVESHPSADPYPGKAIARPSIIRTITSSAAPKVRLMIM
jgi:hypothetical protein